MNSHSSVNISLTNRPLAAACEALQECQQRQIERHRGLLTILRQWWQRARQRASLRRQLMEMDIALIEKDIGVPSGSLTEEARKPFWQQ